MRSRSRIPLGGQPGLRVLDQAGQGAGGILKRRPVVGGLPAGLRDGLGLPGVCAVGVDEEAPLLGDRCLVADGGVGESVQHARPTHLQALQFGLKTLRPVASSQHLRSPNPGSGTKPARKGAAPAASPGVTSGCAAGSVSGRAKGLRRSQKATMGRRRGHKTRQDMCLRKAAGGCPLALLRLRQVLIPLQYSTRESILV